MSNPDQTVLHNKNACSSSHPLERRFRLCLIDDYLISHLESITHCSDNIIELLRAQIADDGIDSHFRSNSSSYMASHSITDDEQVSVDGILEIAIIIFICRTHSSGYGTACGAYSVIIESLHIITVMNRHCF